MDFRILGPLEVHSENGPLRLGGAKQRAVLAVLLLNANQVVSSDRLIDLLWGDGHPPTAATALQGHISALRKVLQPRRAPDDPDGTLLTRPPGYLISLDAEQLDLARFERLRAQGAEALASGEHAAAREKLVEALSLWRGAPLADLGYEAFAQAEISRLEELRLAAVEDRVHADLALGRHADVVGELESLIAEHPLRERLRAQLMLALYRSGRQAEALEVYRDTRRALVDELGIEPTRELQELERAILAQDASLDLPTRPVPTARPAPAREDAPAAGAGTSAAGSFVGRERELAEVFAGLEGALAGRTALFLVEGEPGIGKSRLADEVASGAAARGAQVLWGRCWEAGGAPAYWPWVQALRTHIRETRPDELRAQLGRGAADVAQMLPDLRDVLGDLPEPPSLDPDGARFRLFDSTASFLRATTRDRPLVLVLDDMHAADASSLLLLRFLARELHDARLVLLVAYRDGEATSNEALGECLAELRREPITRPVQLGGLTLPEVARFVESIAATPPSDEVASAIHAQTEGNPLFVGELVRLMVSEGRLEDPTSDDWMTSIPRGLREVIGQRVRRLSPDCKRLLSVASVLGREFGLQALERVSRKPRDEMLDRLDEAFAARVVGEVPARRGAMRFSHALIRDSLYGDLGPRERPRLHHRAAQALRELYAHDEEPHLAEIAHHLLEAAPAGGVEDAIDYARRAGDRGAALLAYEEAARFYTMALEALALRQVADEPTRCELLLALGDARARAGDAEASKQAYREAARLAESSGVADQLARAAFGYGGRFSWVRASTDPELVPLLERALAAVGEDDLPARALLLGRLAAAKRDDPFRDTRVRLGEEAVAIAEAIGDPTILLRSLDAYWMAVEGPDRLDQLMELGERMIALAERVGDKELLFAVHDHRLHVRWTLADRLGVDAELAVLRALANDLRQPAQRWSVGASHATLVLTEGDLARAEELVAQTLVMGSEAQTWNAAVTHRLSLFVLRRAQGRLSEVADVIRHSVDEYPSLVRFRCAHAHISAHLGRQEEAQSALRDLTSRDLANEHVDSEWLFSMCLLADPCATLGDLEAAAKLYAVLRPYEDRYAEAPVEAAFGSVARALGVLATALGSLDAAERHFELALEIEHRMRALPWLAHVKDAFAHMLMHRRAPGDGARAEQLLAEAVGGYRDLGMEDWAERSAAVPSA